MEILVQDIQTVLEFFAKNSYRANESTTFFVSMIFAQIFSQPPCGHESKSDWWKRVLIVKTLAKIETSRIYLRIWKTKKRSQKKDHSQTCELIYRERHVVVENMEISETVTSTENYIRIRTFLSFSFNFPTLSVSVWISN